REPTGDRSLHLARSPAGRRLLAEVSAEAFRECAVRTDDGNTGVAGNPQASLGWASGNGRVQALSPLLAYLGVVSLALSIINALLPLTGRKRRLSTEAALLKRVADRTEPSAASVPRSLHKVAEV